MSKIIQLTKGKVSILDVEDYEDQNKYNWYAQAISKDGLYYACRRGERPKDGGKRPIFYMHKEIMKVGKGVQVDHINRNSLDNRKENLRICSHEQNQHNRRKFRNNTSGYIGVTVNKNSFSARICQVINGKSTVLYLGSYKTIEEAAEAYDTKALELRGEFAVTNKTILNSKPFLDLSVIPQKELAVKSSFKRPKNLTSRNTSGYRGVYWNRGMKQWQATIVDTINKNTIIIGYFRSKNAAALAYNVEAIRIYKDLAILNIITEEKEHIAPESPRISVANTSGFIGITKVKASGRWQATITNPENKDRRINLGVFNTRHSAVVVYNLKAKELYGESAYLNDENAAFLLVETDLLSLASLKQIKSAKAKPKGSSGYYGVSWSKDHNKWCVSLVDPSINKRKKLGYFSCRHEAAEFYNIKAKEWYGEKAKLNTINKEVPI